MSLGVDKQPSRVWHMPAEKAPQERVWMGFPTAGPTAGETATSLDEARQAWTAVAHAIIEYEPVTMLVNPGDEKAAKQYLSRDIEQIPVPMNDAWLRDTGPGFVIDEQGRLGAVNWCFNGWGSREWAPHEKDSRVAAAITRYADAMAVSSCLVNEGGGIAVDGKGTVLLTETVQRDPRRNPGISREAIESEMRRTLGACHALWLPRGLYRDAQKYGTFGHVDMVASLVSDDHILLHDQRNRSHPDYAIMKEILAWFEETTTVTGQNWKIQYLPAPEQLRDAHGFVDYSYINHLPINGAVIVGTFDDPADATACAILSDAYPERKVVGVDARAIFARGGGIHCITQHQPAL